MRLGGIETFDFCTLGPLLYHFENLANELSIELSYEDIKNVILQYGFHIEVRIHCSFLVTFKEVGYSQNLHYLSVIILIIHTSKF